jgi:hypothetical protein
MLCSYFGIDCVCVLSEQHAWNEVRYGNQWYIVDVTWDDTGGGESYFHLTDAQTKARDQNNYHVAESFYSSLRPSASQSFSASLKSMNGLSQPSVDVTTTATGVTITLDSSGGDVYYTLDGTTPGKSDKYTKPISLTKSGDYVLTAMTVKNGKLSSAYDICSVRIAAGSASITSAANDVSRQIDVTLSGTKTYLGYELSYATDKKFTDEKTERFDTKMASIKGLKQGMTYYIRVRGYLQDAYGNYYYTAYSKTKTVKVTM